MTDVPDLSQTAAWAWAATQAVTRVFVATDDHDWGGLRSALDEKVRLDWTSLNGGEPVELSAGEVVDAWRSLLSEFDVTHHQLGNFLVEEIDAEQVRLRFYGTATHVLAVAGQEDRWVLGARYDAVVRRSGSSWRVGELTLTVRWGQGNQNLLAVAAQRAADRGRTVGE